VNNSEKDAKRLVEASGLQQRLNAIGPMVVKRKIVHLLKIVLAGMRYFQKCPPALSPGR
jgi:hypothetical protein